MLKKYKDKTVLVTGHTGFKGSWLCSWLTLLGAKVVGLSIDIPSIPSHFLSVMLSDLVEDHRLDIQDTSAVKKIVNEVQPDFIFHLAAQALVRKSYESPFETIKTNAIGTASILEAVRVLDKDVVVVCITSDKVYDNVEWAWGYREVDRIGGRDPYSAAKGMAELAIRSYFDCFFNNPDSNVKIGIARAGNVIGGGDWALDRIVPDCIKAWSKNEMVEIRNPKSTRPWQHVLEPLSGYVILAEHMVRDGTAFSQAWNFGPNYDDVKSVEWVVNRMLELWNSGNGWLDSSGNHPHEANLLQLECSKAKSKLNWSPLWNLETTLIKVYEWSSAKENGLSPREISEKQILEYIKELRT